MRRRNVLTRSLQAAAVGVLISPILGASSVAHASPQDLFGYGVRSSAMGMAGPASAEDYEAVFGSPALLAEARKKSLTIGFAFARHALRADTPNGGPLSLPTDEMKTIYIGAALPLPFGGALQDRVTFGVGFLDPVKFLVRGKILYPERYQYPLVAPRVQSLAVLLGLGVRLWDGVYVGVGYEALAAVVGQILIQTDPTGHVGARSDDQVVAAYAPIASFACDLGQNFRVGATFRGELIGRFVINIKAQDLGVPLPDFNVAGLAQYDPMQAGVELRWASMGNAAASISDSGWRGVVGVLARRWSKYPGPNEPTVLANPEYGTGSPPIDAHDTISPRVGIERSIPLTPRAGMRLRAGYAYEPTPLPEQKGFENLLDSTRHVFTAGAGLVLDDSFPIRLDVFAQVHLLESRTNTKDPDTAARTGESYVKAGGTIWTWGMTTGVRF